MTYIDISLLKRGLDAFTKLLTIHHVFQLILSLISCARVTGRSPYV